MSRFYPEKPAPDAAPSEIRVRDALAQLDDDWTVFHSVTWQSRRSGRQGDGEADFILLHPHLGLVVLEVKGGQVEVVQGIWFSEDRHGTRHEIKNPFEQAKDSKYALINYLRSLEPPLSHVPVCHGVVFPNVSDLGTIGTYGPRAISCDREDLRDMKAAILRVVAHWGQRASLSNEVLDRVTRLLAPTIKIRTKLRDSIAEAKEILIELTARQVRTLSQLRLNRRALVLGGAGTGKTVLAVERARRLASDGFRCLLTCYNALLAEKVAKELAGQGSIRVSTFHAFCMQEIRKAGLSVPNEPSDEWWEHEAASLLLSATEKNGTGIDAVVVDEGQDFSGDWITALLCSLSDPDNGPCYVFADSHQELYRREWDLSAWPAFILDLNCRNTRPIADRVSPLYGDPIDTLGAEGPAPVFLGVALDREGPLVVQRLVTRLIDEEGLDSEQIVVLSDSTRLIEMLRTMLAGDHPFTTVGKFGIAVETVKRFKGLESDAIVLALSDSALKDRGEITALAYVGMSRARVALFVLGSPALKKTLLWN